MKTRLLYRQMIQQLKHKNALIVTGARQVGKTTLLKQIFDYLGDKPKLWFDLDNPLDQKIFEDIDYKAIYRRLQNLANNQNQRLYVFVDEIQNLPVITKIIKYLIDHYKVKFIVTGSSNFYLKNLFPESLSGRKFLYILNPLSFQEFLYFKDIEPLEKIKNFDLQSALKAKDIIDFKRYETAYEEYLNFGGFPEVVLTRDQNLKRQILNNIFTSFFEKDLKILSDYKDIRELRDLILLLVPRVGSMIDVSKIASELGVDRLKVYSYLEFLQGTFFIKLLPKFSRSIDRSVAGGKKVYFSDTGILTTISTVNEGQLFENTVINQLSLFGKLSFYNKRNTSEIDIILDKKIAFEVKLRGTKEDIEKVKELSGNLKIKESYVISRYFRESVAVFYPMFL